MKHNKGFTLIEIMGVIIIIGFLALIITPMISKVVEKAKYKAANESAKEYISAVGNAVAAGELTGNRIKVKTLQTNVTDEELAKITVGGMKPSYTYIEFDNYMNVKIAKLCMNGYSIDYNNGALTESNLDYCNLENAPTNLAGLYDKDGNLLASWAELTNIYGLDVERENDFMYLPVVYSSLDEFRAIAMEDCNCEEPTYDGLTFDEFIDQYAEIDEENNTLILWEKIPTSITDAVTTGGTIYINIEDYYGTITTNGNEFELYVKKEEVPTYLLSRILLEHKNLRAGTKLVIGDGVKSIAPGTFTGSGLQASNEYMAVETLMQIKDIVLGRGITKIGTFQFFMASIDHLYIPSSVKKIDPIPIMTFSATIPTIEFENTTGWYITSTEEGKCFRNTSSGLTMDSCRNGDYLSVGVDLSNPTNAYTAFTFGNLTYGSLPEQEPISVATYGLFDANDNLLVSWDDLVDTYGLDITKSCGQAGGTGCGLTVFSNNSLSGFLKIPPGITKIGANQFRNCQTLKGVEIPSSVVEIGAQAFNKISTSVFTEAVLASPTNWYYVADDGSEVAISGLESPSKAAVKLCKASSNSPWATRKWVKH